MRCGVRRATTIAVALVLAVACGREASRDADAAPTYVERVIAARQPTAGAPPLLVLLHGIGSNENDLVSLAGALDPRFTIVSLRAPRPWHGGWAWFALERRADGTLAADPAQARVAVADLARWLAAAPQRLGTDPHRTFLLGFSQGAMMSLGVVRTTPERVAGVVALSGRYDPALFDEPIDRAAIGKVVLFVAHGTQDELLPLADGRAIRDAFTPLAAETTYREYPTAHAIAPDEIRDVAAWLTTQLDRSREGR